MWGPPRPPSSSHWWGHKGLRRQAVGEGSRGLRGQAVGEAAEADVTVVVELLVEATLDCFIELRVFMKEWLTRQFSQSDVVGSPAYENKTTRSLCVSIQILLLSFTAHSKR